MTNDKVTNVTLGGRAAGFNALKQKSHNPRNEEIEKAEKCSSVKGVHDQDGR